MTTVADSRVEANKALVRHVLQRLSDGDVEPFIAALTPGYTRHCQAMPPGLQEIRGPEQMRGFLTSNRATFPDYREEIDMLVGEGDMVAWRSVGTGTQQGPMGPFPATGRSMSIVIIGMHRFENGKIVETWTSWDNVAALAQLGLMPT